MEGWKDNVVTWYDKSYINDIVLMHMFMGHLVVYLDKMSGWLTDIQVYICIRMRSVYQYKSKAAKESYLFTVVIGI